MRREPASRCGRGARWLAVWTGPDGRRRSKAWDRRSDAHQYDEMKEADAAWVHEARRKYAEEVAGLADRSRPAEA
jgi:hypothetical protein